MRPWCVDEELMGVLMLCLTAVRSELSAVLMRKEANILRLLPEILHSVSPCCFILPPLTRPR